MQVEFLQIINLKNVVHVKIMKKRKTCELKLRAGYVIYFNPLSVGPSYKLVTKHILGILQGDHLVELLSPHLSNCQLKYFSIVSGPKLA